VVNETGLVKPAERLSELYPGFGFRNHLTFSTGPRQRVLLADPSDVADVFGSKADSNAWFLRDRGVFLNDFGGPRAAPVWWKSPYLVLPLSRHLSRARKRAPEGFEVLAEQVRSTSGSLFFLPLFSFPYTPTPAAIVRKAKELAEEGKGAILRLPAGTWTAFYEQFEAPEADQQAEYRNVVFKHTPPPRRAKPRQKRPEKWEVVLDLRGVRTRDEFIGAVARRLHGKGRRGWPFWRYVEEACLHHWGPVVLRMVGWRAFEQRQKRISKEWQKRIRVMQTVGEISNLTVEYDTAPAVEVVFPTRRLFAFLAEGTDFTLGALARRLRAALAGSPAHVEQPSNRRVDVEVDGWRMHVAFLTDGKELAELRDDTFLSENVVDLGPEDFDKVRTAPRVLDIWSNDPDPRDGARGRTWNAVVETVRGSFREVYLTEEEEPLAD
jgi:hypothetical protein